MTPIRQFLRTYVPRFRGLYVAGLAFLLATTVITITVPKVLGRIIDQLQQPTMTFDLLRPAILHLMVLALLLFLCRSVSRILIFYPGRKIEQRVRQDFFDHLTCLPRTAYERYSVGDLMSRGINDIASVRVMLSMAILHIVNTGVLGIGAVHGMALLSPRLTWWVMGPVLAMFLTTFVAVRFFYRFIRQAQESLGQLSESVRETLGASAVLNTYPVQEELLARFDRWNQEYSYAVQRVATARACVFPMMTTFVGIGALLALFVGGRMVIAGALSLGALVAFMTYVWILSDPAVAIGWVMNAMQRGHSALVRIYEIITTEAPCGDGAPLPSRDPARMLDVRALTFQYETTQPSQNGGPFQLSIDQFTLRQGQRVGIFGPTGSGKSTLASLIAGVIEAPAGTVCINGRDQRAVPITQWRQWVSYVPQQTTLFATSIAENIRMAQPADTARLADTIDMSVLGDEMAHFPRGAQTQVGESGVTLSGGQRQRVSLARALYHGGELIILDDMTSAVDLLTEARLLRNIAGHVRHAMLVLISHRVSTLRHCDQIVVLEHGRITDRGTHEALMTRNAMYRGTWAYEQRAQSVPEDARAD